MKGGFSRIDVSPSHMEQRINEDPTCEDGISIKAGSSTSPYSPAQTELAEREVRDFTPDILQPHLIQGPIALSHPGEITYISK
jgi:hypothetical protein